jgi:hypothetical protein
VRFSAPLQMLPYFKRLKKAKTLVLILTERFMASDFFFPFQTV